MNDLVIREAAPEDIAALLALYSAAWISDEAAFSVDEAVTHLAVLQQYPYFRVFVATVGETVVGTYELMIMDNMAKRGRKSGIVEDVAVAPAYRGQGVGRAMMQHALEQCRNASCYKLALSSNLKRDGAHAFYESLGFARHGYSFQVELSEW